MRPLALLALVSLIGTSVWTLEAKKKKKDEEEETQTLQLPRDPPNAVTADPHRLVFHVSPLSAKGLLSQQVRDALKALFRSAGGASIVRVRAFVAGSGDLRRVRDLVSEAFTERRQNLPALSVVQVGALPLEGAQVVLESTAVSKKSPNPGGLLLISGQGASSPQPLAPVAPLAEKSLAKLETALRAGGSEPSDVLRVTCFLSSLDPKVRGMFAASFPAAALNYVQIQRAPGQAVAECEAVARLRRPAAAPLEFVNPDGLTSSPNFSQLALVSAPTVILTGTQQSFGFQDADARQAFGRLEKVLEQSGGSIKQVAFSSLYPLSASLGEQVRRIRFEFYDKSRPPASTMLPFEGLPSMDAGFAVDVIAIKQ